MITLYAFFDRDENIIFGSTDKETMMDTWKDMSGTFKRLYQPKLKIGGLSKNWQAWDIEEEIRQAKEDEDDRMDIRENR